MINTKIHQRDRTLNRSFLFCPREKNRAYNENPHI
ncbi:hypothetical protein SEA_DIZZYRUDY_33 [Microbacterium phage DizzyRudy]|nr:hypothetical protein SEA_DIZZYRUDY_33 [Microbacterium phage DizzyRudy]